MTSEEIEGLTSGSIGYESGFVPTRDSQPLTIGGPSYLSNIVSVFPEGRTRSASNDIPKVNGVVTGVRGSYPLTTGRPGYPGDRTCLAAGDLQELASDGIPDKCRVVTRDGQPLTIGRPGHSADRNVIGRATELTKKETGGIPDT